MDATPYDRRREIDALFGQALDRRPEERRAFLEDRCAEDSDLLHEVERLLVDHGAAEGFLDDRRAWFDTSRLRGLIGEEDDAAANRAGQRVGLYRIVEPLGRGGMGTVFLAERDDGQFEKRVALKVIKRGMDTDAIRRRFRYERQILARLEHPNIARLLDGGVTEDGLPYFVMEYVRGEPIDQYCDRKQLALDDRLRLFLTVCEAVQYAHRNLVVHRDLKPSNILVAEPASARTRAGRVKLLDFGIARLLDDPEQAETLPMTRTGLGWMTPSYAAPEQIRGNPVTTTTDVYALGMILYELLTGHRPYQIRGLTPSEVERVVCERMPAKPSTAVIRAESGTDEVRTPQTTPEAVSRLRSTEPDRLRRWLKGDLDNIILKALRKEPDRRYSSVEQFAEDLRRHREKRPVLARKPTRRYRLSRFVRRHRIEVTAAVLVVLSLIGGLVGTLWQAYRATEALHKVEELADIGLSYNVANKAGTLQEQQLDLSLLLSVQALRFAETYEARDRLLAGLQANPHLVGYFGKQAEIAALSPDRAVLATSHADSTIRLWDARTRRPFGSPLTAAPARVALLTRFPNNESLVFSPDGALLAASLEDSTIRLWEVHSGRFLGPLETGDPLNPGLAFSPDGTQVAAGSAVDGSVILWEVDTRQRVGAFSTGFELKTTNLAFSPEGTVLTAWGASKRAPPGEPPRLQSILLSWNVATRRRIGPPLIDHAWFGTQAFSPDGAVWVTGAAGGTSLVLREPTTGRPLGQPLVGFTSPVQHLAFSPDSTVLAKSHADSTIRLWNARTGRLLTGQYTAKGIEALAFSTDGGAVIVEEENGLVFWEIDTQQKAFYLNGRSFLHHQPLEPGSLRFLLKEQGKITLVDFAKSQAIGQLKATAPRASGEIARTALDPAEKRLALGYDDGTVVLWDVVADRPAGESLSGLIGSLSHLAFSPDGTALAASSEAGRFVLWDVATRGYRGELQTGPNRLWGLAFSPDGQALALADSSSIALLDAATLKPLHEPLADPVFGGGLGLAFSPDGKQLAAIVFTDEIEVVVWDLATREAIRQFRPSGAVGTMAFSPDGTLLALGTGSVAELWDVEMGHRLGDLPGGEEGGAEDIAFSPDGRLIATAHYDGTIRLWEVERRLRLGEPLKGHTSPVKSLAFSPDESKLYSADAGGAVGVWPVSLELWKTQACRLAHRNLTPAEWQTYIEGRTYQKTCPDLPNP